MRILSKIFLHALVLVTLICVGLGSPPRQVFVAGPLQPTSIRSGQSPDFECLVVRRTLPSDFTQSNDHRVALVGILPSTAELGLAPYRLAPEHETVARAIAPRLVIAHPRARAPPARA